MIDLFKTPKIIGVVGMPNSGKSNLIYYLIEELRKNGKFNLRHFGLRNKMEGEINSVKELEQIKNSIIFLDEFNTLFDLDNRKLKRQIENTIRLIFHNNNILILCGVGENYKKFISSKVDVIIYKKVFYSELINGSRIKTILIDYQDLGNIKGSEVLNLEPNQALVYDGSYRIENIPYLKDYDTKRKNKTIFTLQKDLNTTTTTY